jgi:ABC-type Fe3+-hydroxamate transport system substrate-binding protein
MPGQATRPPATHEAPTRRETIRTGGAVAVGGLLAGCADLVGQGEESDSESDASYTATIAPVGEVEFAEKPSDVFSITSHHADMAFALGYGNDLNAVYAPGYNDSLINAFAAALDGVSVDWSELYDSWNPVKEKLYDLNSDIHLADPANVLTMGNWSQEDIQEIEDTVGPWFGNSLSAQHSDPPEAYADSYEYYSLWVLFGRVAVALDETARYEALGEVHAALRDRIESGLPPTDERPTVGMILPSTSGDSYWAYDVNTTGFYASHTRPMGVTDAFGDLGRGDEGSLDYEALLEADPDVLFVLGGLVDYHDMAAIRADLEDDPAASEVTAVDEGRVYVQGTRYQGPITHLFQLEMTAKQLYPEKFGTWPRQDGGPYPTLSSSEQLFDHDRVAEIITEGVQE